jgi:hypothetical protein
MLKWHIMYQLQDKLLFKFTKSVLIMLTELFSMFKLKQQWVFNMLSVVLFYLKSWNLHEHLLSWIFSKFKLMFDL